MLYTFLFSIFQKQKKKVKKNKKGHKGIDSRNKNKKTQEKKDSTSNKISFYMSSDSLAALFVFSIINLLL